MTSQIAPASSSLQMDSTFWIATSIFFIAYIIIVSEKIHKTKVALFAAALMIVLKILDQHEAFTVDTLGVDWNVVVLLVSMMIIVNLLRPTGLFEYIAIKSAKLAKGEPVRIMILFALVTAFLSALLDNVTTVLLITPVTLFVADALKVDPRPYLISTILASNIGGTATMIGDPPNLMIASKAGLNFMDFIYHLAPIILIIFIIFLLVIKIFFGSSLKTTEELKLRIIAMDEKEAIRNTAMLKKSLFVLAVVLVGFACHDILNYEPATVALFGAALLLLLSDTFDPKEYLAEVEWPTIFFFIGLFIIVGGVVKVGLINWMSLQVIDLTEGSYFATSMAIIWFSAVASAIVDNIPFVATMNPLIIDMAKQYWPNETGIALLQHHDLMPIWWSLALGSCLGGNASPIGASANVIVLGMAEKAGHKISFLKFIAYGLPTMIITVSISAIYIWLRYYVLSV